MHINGEMSWTCFDSEGLWKITPQCIYWMVGLKQRNESTHAIMTDIYRMCGGPIESPHISWGSYKTMECTFLIY